MLSALLILVAAAAWGLVHSWLASLGLKARLRERYGEKTDRFYRLAYNIFAGLSQLPVIALVPLLPDRTLYIIPFPLSLLFLMVQGAAVLFVLIGVYQTGAGSFLGISQALGRSQGGPPGLVTGGLYRLVRHPLYLGGLVFLWAAPLMTRNLLVLFIAFSIYLVLGALVEERKLLKEYGPEYAAYRQKTPMLFPWPRPGR